MRTLLLLLLVSLTNIGFAQDEYINYAQGNESYHQFKVGATSYLLADNVNVREKPSSKGAIIANLPIGTAVKIIKVSNKKLRLNGFKTNWYKVSFEAENNVSSGYVWGGLIAEGTVRGVDSKVLFLYGIASVKKEDKGDYTSEEGIIQVRACKNHQELSKIKLKSASNYLNIHHWLGNYGNKGLNNVVDILEFGESAESCGGVNACNVIFWDGKNLMLAKTLYPGSDAPAYASDRLIFPSDKGGEKGKIIGDQEEGWYSQDQEKDIVEYRKQVEYIWTGTTLQQTKVLLDKKYDVRE